MLKGAGFVNGTALTVAEGTTVKVPANPLAVRRVDVASPVPSVVATVVAVPLAKVAGGPADPATTVKVTWMPASSTGALDASLM